MKKIDDIEKLRGFACILVFIQHIALICPYAFLVNLLPQYLSLGSGGVHIFFAISGFVITLSLRNKLANISGDTFLERLRSSGAPLLSFYKRRFFRIMPAMLVVWTVVGIFLTCTEENCGWVNAFFRVPFEIVTGTYPYIVDKFAFVERVHCAGTGPFWTLAVELQFYVIWPIVMLLCKNDNIRAIISLVLGFIALFFVQPITTVTIGYQYYALFNNVSELFFGSFFALIYDQTKNYAAKNRLATTLAMIGAFAVIWTFLGLLGDHLFFIHMSISIAAIFALVLAVFSSEGFVIPIVTDTLAFLGKRSYSFYVCQLATASIVMWFLDSIYCPVKNATPLLQFLIFVCTLSLVTEIVYNLVEKPSRKLGQC